MTRRLPHSLDAERSVLGSILIDNDGWLHIARPKIALTERDFFAVAHQHIFSAMRRLVGRPAQPGGIDLVTLVDVLREDGTLDAVGGPAYVASLVDGVPRSTNVEYYAQIVKEKATLRQLITSADKILADADEAERAADRLLSGVEADSLLRELVRTITKMNAAAEAHRTASDQVTAITKRLLTDFHVPRSTIVRLHLDA